jgi:adenosylcobyric acid synthase
VRSVAELGQPDLVILPGSKATRRDLDWFRQTGLARAVRSSGAAVVAICAGLQMCGTVIEDPDGVEGPPGSETGLGWLPVRTIFASPKILDRPAGTVVAGPASGQRVAGYRIHHGRVEASGEVAPLLHGQHQKVRMTETPADVPHGNLGADRRAERRETH